MGPEGGSGGGVVVAEGTPEHVATVAASHTGRFLAPILAGRPVIPASRTRATKAVAAKSVAAKPVAVKSAAKPLPTKPGW